MTDTEQHLMDEQRRLLVEGRVLREWLLELLSGGDEAKRERLSKNLDAQVQTQLGKAKETAEELRQEAVET